MAVSTPICNFGEKSHDFNLQSTEGKLISLNNIKGIRCPMPKGAFYIFPNVEGTGMTSREFADGLLEEGGVAGLAGESFGKYGKGCVRFSFANSAENIERALERIDNFVKSKA